MSLAIAETATIPLEDVRFDPSIYPRSKLDLATVVRYAEAYQAGERLPPIILEAGTNRLFDGRHRHQARVSRKFADVEVEYHVLPPGVSAKLYAAGLSARNGLPILDSDLKALAREVYSTGDDTTIVAVARYLRRSRSTIESWIWDLRQERKNAEAQELAVKRLMVMLLREMGWTQQRTADLLGIAQSSVATIINQAEFGTIDNLDEAILRAAINRLPEEVVFAAEGIAERWREARLFSKWSDEERELLTRLRDGETVVLNMHEGCHAALWRWAEQAELAVRIDRHGQWGNPFLLLDDGDRDTVCNNYETHYWPHKPSLRQQVHTLRGKALGCWCAPERCHGDFLKEEAEQ